MNRAGFRATLLSALDNEKVYIDVLPEGKPTPALTYSHITGSASRLVSGVRVNAWDTWRVRIIGTSRAKNDEIIEKLLLLDNTNDNIFKNIFVEIIQAVPSDPDDKYVSSFIDFKTYNR